MRLAGDPAPPTNAHAITERWTPLHTTHGGRGNERERRERASEVIDPSSWMDHSTHARELTITMAERGALNASASLELIVATAPLPSAESLALGKTSSCLNGCPECVRHNSSLTTKFASLVLHCAMPRELSPPSTQVQRCTIVHTAVPMTQPTTHHPHNSFSPNPVVKKPQTESEISSKMNLN